VSDATLVWLAAGAYAGVVSAAALVRHDRFRSGGYDLGIFDQAIWLLGHGYAPFSTVRGRNLFADHFQPALVLLAPLGALSITPTALFILQSLLLAAVSPLLYALAIERGARPRLALGVAVLWLASPLTQWANLFDYHPETAAPLLLALGALALERGRVGLFLATAVVASCLKEDVCLVYLMWGALLALGRRRRLGLVLVAASAAWFLLTTKVAIPAFGGDLDFYSTRFAGDRGTSIGAVFLSLVEHPLKTISDVATPANGKLLLALVACSGGLALLAPRLLLLALPTLAANLLSAYSYQHELRFQYQLVPAAVFAIAAAYGAGRLRRLTAARTQAAVAALFLLGALGILVVRSPALDELRQGDAPNAAAKRRALALAPTDASVAASPDLVAHVSNRRLVYQLPEPFFTRPTNGEYWSAAELARRARAVEYVLFDLDSLDPGPRRQAALLPGILRRRGYVEIFRDGDVRVFHRSQ
jgi:uncharacterized membrane protein